MNNYEENISLKSKFEKLQGIYVDEITERISDINQKNKTQ
jgi:hypothetical protein